MSINLPLEGIKTTLSCLQETKINYTCPTSKCLSIYLSPFFIPPSHHLLRIQEDSTAESNFCMFLGECGHLTWTIVLLSQQERLALLTTIPEPHHWASQGWLLRVRHLEGSNHINSFVTSHTHLDIYLFTAPLWHYKLDAYCTLKLNRDWMNSSFSRPRPLSPKSLRWRSNHCGLQLCQSTRLSSSLRLRWTHRHVVCRFGRVQAFVTFPKVGMHFQ